MTDKPYTPTTEQVRDGFRYDELAEWYDPVTPHHVINGRAFDRWLNQIEAAAEQRGAVRALLRAERLMKEDRPELGETVSVKLIIDWLRMLAGQCLNHRTSQEEGKDE